MRTPWLAALACGLLAAVALAGCVGEEDPGEDPEDPAGEAPVPDDWHDEAIPLGADHDHSAPEDHRDRSTPNFEVVGHDPLQTEYHGFTSGDYFCGERASTDERDLVVTHSFGTDVAFLVVDVTDPAAPELVAEIALPNSHVYDVAVTPDGAYAALGVSEVEPTTPDDVQEPDVPPEPPAEEDDGFVMETRSACGTTTQQTDETPYKNGVLLVDLADPTQPEISDYRGQPPVGPHSVHAQLVDGEPRILTAVANLQHQSSYFGFFQVEETPFGPRLVEEDVHQAQYPGDGSAGDQPPLTNGHVDGWIQEHPVENATYAYLANWDGGMHVLEHDPDNGTWNLVSVWNDYDASAGPGMTGQIHGTLPMEGTDDEGRHITWIGQEVLDRPEARPTGQILKMDTTDPTEPEPLARWTLPTDVAFNGSLQFSTHYVRVVDDTLFVSLYHGGVWAAGTEPIDGTDQLPTKGVFVPDREVPNPPDANLTFLDWAPTVLDVLDLPGDELAVLDGASGVYTVRYNETAEASVPQPEPWNEDGWTPDQGAVSQPPSLEGLGG
jgi:hypothetical protein